MSIEAQCISGYDRSMQSICAKLCSAPQDLADSVMQVAKNNMVQRVATEGYTLYSLLSTYPKQPLWALYTPILAAANFFLPKKLRYVTQSVPTWLKSYFIFKVTKKQLASEAAMATLFMSTMAFIPEEYKVPCSVLLMGMLPKLMQSEATPSVKKES